MSNATDATNFQALLIIVSLLVGLAWGWAKARSFGQKHGFGGSARFILCMLGAPLIGFLAALLVAIGAAVGKDIGAVFAFITSCLIGLYFRSGKKQKTTSKVDKSTNAAPQPIIKEETPVDASSRSLEELSTTFFRIDYIDSNGRSSQRDVLPMFYAEQGDRQYIQAAFGQGETRSFRIDRIQGTVIDLETGELMSPEQWFVLLKTYVFETTLDEILEQSADSTSPNQSKRKQWQIAVYFAGFGGDRLRELEELAQGAGWQIRWNISPTVDYVVANGRAGKNQIEEAERLDRVTVIDEETFRAMV